MAAPTYSTGGPTATGFAGYFAPVSRVMNPTPTSAQQTWITAQLDTAYDQASASFWGTLRAEAALLKVAHLFQVEIRGTAGAGAGAIESESADEWSLSYAVPAESVAEYWGSTPEGRRLLNLRRGRMGLFSRVSR